MKDARTLVTTAALTAALALVSYGPAQSAAALVVDPLPTYSHHALLIVHGHAPLGSVVRRGADAVLAEAGEFRLEVPLRVGFNHVEIDVETADGTRVWSQPVIRTLAPVGEQLEVAASCSALQAQSGG